MMLNIIVTLFMSTMLFSIPVWFILKQLKISYWWDYGIVFYATVVWFLVGDFFNIGGQQSLANGVAEPLYIHLFSIFVTTTRYLLFKWTKIGFNRLVSFVCILLVISFAIFLRLYMPTLPG